MPINTELKRLIKSGTVAEVASAIKRAGGVAKIVEDDGMTLLHLAAANNRQDLVGPLLARGGYMATAKLSDGREPIHIAIQNGCTDFIIALRKVGVDVNEPSKLLEPVAVGAPPKFAATFPINYAIRARKASSIEALIRDVPGTVRADIKNLGQNNATYLHTAAKRFAHELVDTLVAAGLGVDSMTTASRQTPLFSAVTAEGDEDDRLRTIQALVRNGATVNAKDVRGFTPLHYAAYSGNLATVEALLRAGANPLLRENETGETALHLAAAKNHPDIINALVASCPEIIDIERRDGLCAIDVAERNGNAKAFETLKDLGASLPKIVEADTGKIIAREVGRPVAVIRHVTTTPLVSGISLGVGGSASGGSASAGGGHGGSASR